jgi:predicted negative regulator of RcsB-dependent stress response
MVHVYANEQEQLEHLKKMWQEYGLAIILGVVIAIVAGFGWRYLQHRHEHTLEHASMRYEQLLTNVVNGNTEAVENQATRLITRYPRTPYAEFAALQLARQDVYEGKLSDAEDKLQWVMQNGETKTLREVARIRAARVLIAQNQPDKALKLLNDISDTAYSAAAYEVKGDALLATGKPDQARVAYQNAMKAFPGFEVIRPILQMKIDNLTGADSAVTTTKS